MNGNSDRSTTTENANAEAEAIAGQENFEENFERDVRRSAWSNQIQIAVRALRRFGASTLELGMAIATATIPFSLGWFVNQDYSGKLVPLNPPLAIAFETIAESLSLPDCPQQSALSPTVNSEITPQTHRSENQSAVVWCPGSVAPVTNLLWSIAIATPALLTIAQLYQLGQTGQTLPKRWLNIQVVTRSGSSPGLLRILWRETGMRWVLPLTIAYSIWYSTGAIPDLLVLAGLTAAIWLLDGIAACFDRSSRTLHDRWAGTLVIDISRSQPSPTVPWKLSKPLSETSIVADDMAAVETGNDKGTIIRWIREHQEISLVVGILLTAIGILSALVGTQVYVQQQANERSRHARENEKFLKLVNQFAINERQGAILALGSLNHPEAGIKMLTDLLGLEDNPEQIETIEQALVSAGSDALPYLQKLNQALRADLDSLSFSGNETEQQITALRHRSTKRAIGKLLRLYSGDISNLNLNRIDLGQNSSTAAQFTLVLEKINLSGIQLRGAILTGASFHGSQFYGSGSDRRFGTFDDTKADLSAADLRDANLSEAFLIGAIMEKIDLSRANLNRANLSNTHLMDANLSSAQLIGANLRGANLANAKLIGVRLGTADLFNVELSGARLNSISGKGANFQFANLSDCDFYNSDLSEADLQDANLQNANLEATNLSGTNLRNANLQNANLQDADLTSADLRGAILTGANVSGAMFVAPQAKKTDTFIVKSSEQLSIGLLQGVNFNEVTNLDLKQLSYLCSQGAVHRGCTLDKQPRSSF